MNQPDIIGLTGVARAGKDSVAQCLRDLYGYRQESFAAPIREFVARILGCDLATLESIKEKPIAWLGGTTPRWMMQTVGTEWGRRTIDPDLWVKACMHRVADHINLGSRVVISDVRFDNEAENIIARGGHVWRIERPGAGSVSSAHASEAGIHDNLVTHTLQNVGTLVDLRITVVRVLEGRAT